MATHLTKNEEKIYGNTLIKIQERDLAGLEEIFLENDICWITQIFDSKKYEAYGFHWITLATQSNFYEVVKLILTKTKIDLCDEFLSRVFLDSISAQDSDLLQCIYEYKHSSRF